MLNPSRAKIQIGNPATIRVPPHGEQGGSGLGRFDQTPCHNVAARLKPGTGTVPTLAHFPDGIDAVVGNAGQQTFQRRIDFGDHSVVSLAVFQLTQECVVVKARVGTDPHFANVSGQVTPAAPEQIDGAAVGVDVTGSELGRTQMGGVGLQTQQGLVGTLATVARIVADLGAFLTSTDGDD